MAALDYSVERFVVYVAAKAAAQHFPEHRIWAERFLYVPIGALSPPKVKRLRVVHVLDSYERRADAKEYLW